ncbi:MAG: hypothetical protein WC262_10165 [Bacteroidales bacterium]|jgi:hypothetical protein
MAIKKVTVKFDSCRDCPVMMYSGCEYAVDCGMSASCPLGDSTMMNRYTDIKSPANGGVVTMVDTIANTPIPRSLQYRDADRKGDENGC